MKTKTTHTPGQYALIANDLHVPANVGRPDKIIGLFATEEAAWDAAEGCGSCDCGGPSVVATADNEDARAAIAKAEATR